MTSKKFKILALGLIGAYILVGVLFFIYQRQFIYYPSAQNFYDCPAFAVAQKITQGQTRIYVKKNSNKWLVFYHGNAGSACGRSYILSLLNDSDYSVAVVEYSGYSNDPTPPTQQALMQNVKDTVGFLKTQQPVRLVLMGESLGTALAAYHSTLEPYQKLVLISPFDSLANEAQSQFWFYPAKFMLWDKYESQDWLAKADHVLIIHGTNDMTIPIALGQKLFTKISGTDKEFFAVPGAAHNDIFNFPTAVAKIKAQLQ